MLPLKKQNLVIFNRYTYRLSQVRLSLLDDVVKHFGAVAHFHDGHSASPVIQASPPELLLKPPPAALPDRPRNYILCSFSFFLLFPLQKSHFSAPSFSESARFHHTTRIRFPSSVLFLQICLVKDFTVGPAGGYHGEYLVVAVDLAVNEYRTMRLMAFSSAAANSSFWSPAFLQRP